MTRITSVFALVAALVATPAFAGGYAQQIQRVQVQQYAVPVQQIQVEEYVQPVQRIQRVQVQRVEVVDDYCPSQQIQQIQQIQRFVAPVQRFRTPRFQRFGQPTAGGGLNLNINSNNGQRGFFRR